MMYTTTIHSAQIITFQFLFYIFVSFYKLNIISVTVGTSPKNRRHTALTMLQSALLHVGLFFFWKAQETQDAVLKRRNFELRSKLLMSSMKVSKGRKQTYLSKRVSLLHHYYTFIWIQRI